MALHAGRAGAGHRACPGVGARARLATRVHEERMIGTQTVSFHQLADGETGVELVLEYALARSGPLQLLSDVLFIRRAQGDALVRTLRRFAVEAAEQAAL